MAQKKKKKTLDYLFILIFAAQRVLAKKQNLIQKKKKKMSIYLSTAADKCFSNSLFFLHSHNTHRSETKPNEVK